MTDRESPKDRFDLSRRRLRDELMDDPGLDPGAHRQALAGLARLNWASRASGPLWQGIRLLLGGWGRSEAEPPAWRRGEEPGDSLGAAAGAFDPSHPRVLDIACGGGDVSRGLARRAQRAGVRLAVHGVDISPVAKEHAAKSASEAVTFGVANVLDDPLPQGFDIVCCSLFVHHLEEERIVTLLGRMATAARVGIVVSDLRRSRLGYGLALASTRLLSRSRVVWTDGPRSVEGALTIAEFENLAKRAGLEGIAVKRVWPQRYLAVWRA